MDGILLVDKPRGITSHDAVCIARRALDIRKIGHAGTLDPMAEGLLVLLIGRATQSQRLFQRHDKTYEAAIRLGIKTNTADADGIVVESAQVPPLDKDRIEQALAAFQGLIIQTPPAFSAVKVEGKPAYWWARRRQAVALAGRSVAIHELSLLAFDGSSLTLRVRCSSGTYVRALAEAIAARLGTVGHLIRLVRLQAGGFMLKDAVSVAWLKAASTTQILERVIPVSSTLLSENPAGSGLNPMRMA